MYGQPRLRNSIGRDNENSLRKCIRPLASELLLQPGHDEIRATFLQTLLGLKPDFPERLTPRRSAVSSSFHDPRNLLIRTSSDLGWLDALIEHARSIENSPSDPCHFVRECYWASRTEFTFACTRLLHVPSGCHSFRYRTVTNADSTSHFINDLALAACPSAPASTSLSRPAFVAQRHLAQGVEVAVVDITGMRQMGKHVPARFQW
jgi:hypothetical protein